MTKNNLAILIADDHPVVLKGLVGLIKDAFADVLIMETSNGSEVLKLARKMYFNLIILDISMGTHNGIELLKQIKNEKILTPVLFLSMYPEDQYAIRAIKAGAHGYLTKSSAPEELINAMRIILSGKRYITPSLAENIATALHKKTSDVLHETLSDREYDVLKLIASGKTVKEAAELLSLSVATVSTYRARLLDKMGMKTNAEITNYAIKTGLVDM
jgi:DNA-binding NarL/FixJ family response regulator